MSQEFEPVIAAVDPALVNNALFVVPDAELNNVQIGETPSESGNAIVRAAQMVGRGALRAGETAVLVAEVTPLNEAMRWSAGAAAIKTGMSPEGVAAVYGGVTLAIESTAAVVGARWLSSERSKKTISWFNGKLVDRGISPDARFNKITKGGVVFFGGAAISEAIEVREKPELEKPEIREYGLKVAAALAGACAVQGYFVGQGFDTPSPGTIGGATIAFGSLFGLAGWARRRIKSEQAAQGIDGKALRIEAKERRKQEKLAKRQEKLRGVV